MASTTGTAVAIPQALPAHIVQYQQRAIAENAGAAGGIKAGSWPRISIGGSKFTLKEGGEAILICDPTNPMLPKMQLELVIVGHNPGVTKIFYEGAWKEGDRDEPDCSSDDGIAPDAHINPPQSTSCATCPKNVWGSKITEQGKQIKACSDNKRLVVLPIDQLQEDAIDLTIRPGSLKEWALYVKELDSRGIPISSVVTNVFFDPSATSPKLLFKFNRFLTAEELAIVEERKQGDDVKLIASPRRTGANLPAGAIPIQPVASPLPPAQPVVPTPNPMAAVAPVQPAPAPQVPSGFVAPVPTPAPVDPYAGLPAHVKPSVDAAGGLATDAGRSVYKALAGRDAPADTPPQPAAPPPTPVVVDPFEGLPPHVKTSVEAAGGLASPAGQQVYKALAGKDAIGYAPAAPAPTTPPPAAAGRKRGKSAVPSPAAPVAPAAAPPVQPAATTFAQAPAGQVVAPGMDIDKMLAEAMAVKVPQ